jgi:hypothetical protein
MLANPRLAVLAKNPSNPFQFAAVDSPPGFAGYRERMKEPHIGCMNMASIIGSRIRITSAIIDMYITVANTFFRFWPITPPSNIL